MNPRRVPIVLVLIATAIGALLLSGPAERTRASSSEPGTRAVPVIAAADALTSSWFCAAGMGAAGQHLHTITVSNLGEDPRTGVLRVLTDTPEVTAETAIVIEPGEAEDFELGDFVDRERAAGIVEMDGGLVTVEHQLSGSFGHDRAPCSPNPAPNWYFAWGRTSLDATFELAVLNPFADDAVVDVTFDTEDGFRSPQAYEGLVVAAGTVQVLQVGEQVQRRDRLATKVVARTGRVVVDRIQVLKGEDTTGLDLSAGVTEPAPVWAFADGRLDPTLRQRVVIFNPGADPAEVSLSVIGSGGDLSGDPDVEPFELVVLPNRQVEVVLTDEDRLPNSLVHAAVVESLDGSGLVVERVVSGVVGTAPTAPGIGAGLAATPGWDVTSTRIEFPSPLDGFADGDTIAVLNPSSVETAQVSIVVRRTDGSLDEVETLALGPQQRADLDPSTWVGERASYKTDPGTPKPRETLVLASDLPVIADQAAWLDVGVGLSVRTGHPVADSLEPFAEVN